MPEGYGNIEKYITEKVFVSLNIDEFPFLEDYKNN